MSYKKVSDFDGLPVLSYETLVGNAIAAAKHTFMVKKPPNFILNESSGKYSNYEYALYDGDIDLQFSVRFSDSSSAFFTYTWTLEDNLYSLDYYYVQSTGNIANICNENEEGCVRWRYRKFEIIGKTDTYYIVKNYQEFFEEGPTDSLRFGNINLFVFEAN